MCALHCVIVAFCYINVLVCVLCLCIPYRDTTQQATETTKHPRGWSFTSQFTFPVHLVTILSCTYMPLPSHPTGAELPERKVKVAFKGENEEQLDVNEGDYVVVLREDSSGEWDCGLLLP